MCNEHRHRLRPFPVSQPNEAGNNALPIDGPPPIAELPRVLKGPAQFWKALTIISFAIMLAPTVCSASDAISLDQLVAEAWARNPEATVYRAEIAR